jgi:hypothetical protein
MLMQQRWQDQQPQQRVEGSAQGAERPLMQRCQPLASSHWTNRGQSACAGQIMRLATVTEWQREGAAMQAEIDDHQTSRELAARDHSQGNSRHSSRRVGHGTYCCAWRAAGW